MIRNNVHNLSDLQQSCEHLHSRAVRNTAKAWMLWCDVVAVCGSEVSRPVLLRDGGGPAAPVG